MADTYTTKQWDMWDQVAQDALGDEAYMHLLIEANPLYAGFGVFPSGITLSLPEIPKTVTEQNNLPPWKR